ncbi:MAG: hypothetical protein ACLTDV_01420 [Eubacterium sp.]
MDTITLGVGSLIIFIWLCGISDSDSKNVTGKENGIGSVDEKMGNRRNARPVKTVINMSDGSDREQNVSFKSAASCFPTQAASSAKSVHIEGQHVSNAYVASILLRCEENGEGDFGICADHPSDLCPGVQEVVCDRAGVTNTQIKYYNELQAVPEGFKKGNRRDKGTGRSCVDMQV